MLRYQQVAESVLDADLYPHEILPSIFTNTYRQVDVRQYAHDLTMRAVAQVRGVCFDPQSTVIQDTLQDIPDNAELTATRALLEPHADNLKSKVERVHYLSGARSMLVRERWNDQGLQARSDFQYGVVESIWAQMQRVRVIHSDPHDVERTLQNGIVVVAPPGAGKTYMATKVLQMCSVGRRVFPEDKHPQSALVAVPSLKLLEQYLSNSPRNMFRELLGRDTPISEYHGGVKQLGAVTLITHNSLRLATQRGEICRGSYDNLVFDEVHHLSAEENFKAMRRLYGSVIGMTASPIYTANRNLRQWFPHEGGGDFVDFIHKGILNPVELSTYTAENNKQAAVTAAQLMADWIKEGLRVATYCLPGGDCAQARSVAEITNRILGEERVRPPGRFKHNTSEADIAAFSEDKLAGLVLTGMLKEGWDEDVDGVIIVGPRYSMIDMIQMAGRISRLGTKVSRLAEVIPEDSHDRSRQVSIWQALGIDNVRSVRTLITRSHDEEGGRYGELDTSEKVPDVTADLRQLCDAQRKMFITSEIKPLQGDLIEIGTLASEFDTSPSYLQVELRKAGIPEYIRSFCVGQESQEEYLVNEKAREYLQDNPPPKIDPGAKDMEEMCSEHNLPQYNISWAAEECGVKRERILGPDDDRRLMRYSAASVEKIDAYIRSIPFATDSDVLQAGLAQQVGGEFLQEAMAKFGIVSQNKRLVAIGSVRGVKEHISAQDAETIIQEHRRLRGGEPDEIVSKKRLPVHLVAQTAIKRRFGFSEETFEEVLRGLQKECRDISLQSGGVIPCISWQGMQAIENQHLASDRLTRIDYARLPDGSEDDTSDVDQMYATIVRAYYGQVAADDEVVDFALAATALSLTKPALRHLVFTSDIVQVEADKAVKMEALVRALPKSTICTRVSTQYISSRGLMARPDEFGLTREALADIIMKLAYLSPTRTIFCRTNSTNIGDVYFPRASIIPYIKRQGNTQGT